MLELAEAADQSLLSDGVVLPDEIKRREDRLAAIADAKAKIAARAQERQAREKAEYDARMARRADKAEQTGKKTGGKPPKAPDATPRPEDQINLTHTEGYCLRTNERSGMKRPCGALGYVPPKLHYRPERIFLLLLFTPSPAFFT